MRARLRESCSATHTSSLASASRTAGPTATSLVAYTAYARGGTATLISRTAIEIQLCVRKKTKGHVTSVTPVQVTIHFYTADAIDKGGTDELLLNRAIFWDFITGYTGQHGLTARAEGLTTVLCLTISLISCLAVGDCPQTFVALYHLRNFQKALPKSGGVALGVVLRSEGSRRPKSSDSSSSVRFKLSADYGSNSAGRPVSLSMRLAIGGWVENRLEKSTPSNGATMNRCAVEGVACMGMRFEYASSFLSALARA